MKRLTKMATNCLAPIRDVSHKITTTFSRYQRNYQSSDDADENRQMLFSRRFTFGQVFLFL